MGEGGGAYENPLKFIKKEPPGRPIKVCLCFCQYPLLNSVRIQETGRMFASDHACFEIFSSDMLNAVRRVFSSSLGALTRRNTFSADLRNMSRNSR